MPAEAARNKPRSSSLAAASSLPSADALLLVVAALLALSVFELAAWLATAPLTTLIYSVAFVPLALFITAVVSGRP